MEYTEKIREYLKSLKNSGIIINYTIDKNGDICIIPQKSINIMQFTITLPILKKQTDYLSITKTVLEEEG